MRGVLPSMAIITGSIMMFRSYDTPDELLAMLIVSTGLGAWLWWKKE